MIYFAAVNYLINWNACYWRCCCFFGCFDLFFFFVIFFILSFHSLPFHPLVCFAVSKRFSCSYFFRRNDYYFCSGEKFMFFFPMLLFTWFRLFFGQVTSKDTKCWLEVNEVAKNCYHQSLKWYWTWNHG